MQKEKSQVEGHGYRKGEKQQKCVDKSKWMLTIQNRVTSAMILKIYKIKHYNDNKWGIYMELKCLQVFADICDST